MKYTVLHNPEDRMSREFIASAPEGAELTIYTDPEARALYPFVSGFPSVVIDVPAHTMGAYSFVDHGTGATIDVPERQVPARKDLLRMPNSWYEVNELIGEWDQFAGENPPK